MKNRFLILVFIALFWVSNLASAAWYENWYIAGSPSVTWHNGQHFVAKDFHREFHFHRHYKMGWGGNASLGYIIEAPNCFNFRPEVEFVYRENKLKKVRMDVMHNGKKDDSEDYLSIGKSIDKALMVNLFMDMPIPIYTCLKIYVGVGLGVSRNRLEMTKSVLNTDLKPPFTSNSWVAARQVMGGISYQLASCLSLTMGYRLFATEKVSTPRYETRSAKTPYIHSIDLGLRLQL